MNLLSGQMAGFHITPTDGAPGARSLFRLHRVTTLAGQNTPLLVLDGIIIASEAMQMLESPLSLLNPNDIASVTLLKDAAATALYGALGANGVLLITTKTGTAGRKLQVQFSSRMGVAQLAKKVPVLSADQFREAVRQYGMPEAQAGLGSASTDWQEEVYENAVSHDQNLALSGQLGWLPYRVSLGYLNQNGILTNSHFTRASTALSLTPSFFKNHLKTALHLRRGSSDSRLPNERMIDLPLWYNPTLPNDAEENHLEYPNPLKLLKNQKNDGTGEKEIANLQVAYSFGFLPGLSAHAQVGYDAYNAKRDDTPSTRNAMGLYSQFEQGLKNKTQTYSLSYTDTLQALQSHVDVTAGLFKQDRKRTYSYSDRLVFADNPYGNDQGRKRTGFASSKHSAFFGKIDYTLKNKYFATYAIRQDESGIFAPAENKFTSTALGAGWLLTEEPFLQQLQALSTLKFRASYGVQYNLPVSQENTVNSFTQTTAILYSPELTPEKTTSINLGVDLGLFQGRLQGSVDYFNRTTNNLLVYQFLNSASIYAYLLSNEGKLKSSGFEVALDYTVVNTPKVKWALALNTSYSTSEIQDLQWASYGSSAFFINSSFPRLLSQNGGSPYAFYLHQQKYQDGKPLEGQYTDSNSDGLPDFTASQSAIPSTLMGLRSHVAYQKWSFDFLARAATGHSVYNGPAAFHGNYRSVSYEAPNNISASVFSTNFRNTQYLSDYYLEDASFFRLE
ncbi:iron complex outermembrane receptor protein [Rufibacter quisquiliarum]|uniref:Iron complex outermembrane receptor protein n=1 Tax=Rufibacter quisquiliarum TaxID=1549639 RepID=A0A839GQN5_9BACT|nr:iron complex outermembrane receptor protein [Rufibacter quisquiliarum]